MLSGLNSFFYETSNTTSMSLSFLDYASEQRICNLLIKERVKVAIKNKLAKDNAPAIAAEIASMMPPRRLWKNPRKQERVRVVEGNEVESRNQKQILTRSLILTISSHRKSGETHPYLERLDQFIAALRSEIASDAPLKFDSIKIFGKTKKVDKEGWRVLRPLCLFTSLREKILIALACEFLAEKFDHLIHEEVLSYRPARTYHNKEKVVTDRDNAAENILLYRRRFFRQGIYVVECDIQKYFDTINHDIILKYFSAFAQKIESETGDFGYKYAERILKGYLDSYSYFDNVASLNEKLVSSKQRYEIPAKEAFLERGCYSDEEFEASKSKIGIPQGGALSTLVSNVILSSIDCESILAKRDSSLFFNRYGDDILLMHPSKERCQELIDSYCEALTTNKLLYHSFASVSDDAYRYEDGRTRHSIWDMKSRSPFLWGRRQGEREAMDWIGFLGYEIRSTGEVRIRRSSLNDKFKGLKRKYRSRATTLYARGEAKLSDEKLRQKLEESVNAYAGDGLAGAKSLTRNKYSMEQARRLDNYAGKLLRRLLFKIVKRNNLPHKLFDEYLYKAREKNCLNYRSSIKN